MSAQRLTYENDRGTTYDLAGRSFPEIPRPDRDVIAALLRYALEKLEEQSFPLLEIRPGRAMTEES